MAEVIGGVLTGILALLADVGYMVVDVASVVVALLGIRLPQRSLTSARSCGYSHAAILAGLANASVRILVSRYILCEPSQRCRAPQAVESGPMLASASR